VTFPPQHPHLPYNFRQRTEAKSKILISLLLRKFTGKPKERKKERKKEKKKEYLFLNHSTLGIT